MIVIAGNGPSAKEWDGPITIGTKKTQKPCQFKFVPTNSHAQFVTDAKILTLLATPQGPRYFNGNCKGWRAYYRQFNPYREKPSSGMAAIFCAIELWGVRKVGVIGFENILDGSSKRVSHDWKAEHDCIRSLVTLVDLRNAKTLRRIRPEGIGSVSRFLPERDGSHEPPNKHHTITPEAIRHRRAAGRD